MIVRECLLGSITSYIQDHYVQHASSNLRNKELEGPFEYSSNTLVNKILIFMYCWLRHDHPMVGLVAIATLQGHFISKITLAV